MSGTLPEKLSKLLDEISAIDNFDLRAELLIEFASRYQGVPEHICERPYPKSAQVPGCESEAYMFAERLSDGRTKLHIAVENPQGISAMALAVILDETLSGADPKSIALLNTEILHTIFGKTLSMGKSQGLGGMLAMARALMLA